MQVSFDSELDAMLICCVLPSASQCMFLFAAASAGNQHVGLTSRGQRFQTQHQHLLSAAASPNTRCFYYYYGHNTLRFAHFTFCGNFIQFFFLLVGLVSLENVLFYCYLCAFWDVYFS